MTSAPFPRSSATRFSIKLRLDFRLRNKTMLGHAKTYSAQAQSAERAVSNFAFSAF
jgi:hypothetical protein